MWLGVGIGFFWWLVVYIGLVGYGFCYVGC